MKLILCIEDELDILENNRKILVDNGYKVLTAANLAEARKHLENTTPDAILLDIMLPDGNGLEYLKELRSQGCIIPIIMLTAWNRSHNKALGLDLGADDYMGKPFEYDELLARIRKVIKQAERIPDTIVKGRLTLNLTSMSAEINGMDMNLTKNEFSLLLFLVQNEGKEKSVEELYTKVWGQSMEGSKHAIQKKISILRKKINPLGYTISSIYGKGYVFESTE